MTHTLALCLCLFLAWTLYAGTYYPSEYQQAFANHQWQNQELRNALQHLVSDTHCPVANDNDIMVASCSNGYRHTSLGYGKARVILFTVISLQKDSDGYFISDAYCNKIFRQSVGPNVTPDPSILNCEHTWPQSLMSPPKDPTQRSDLHHLFATDSKANNLRGTLPFAEVASGGAATPSCPDSKLGYSDGDQNGQKVFEPADAHKGNLARAMFYFAMRYGRHIDPLQEKYLRQWHHDDPVDQQEERRNDIVFSLQKNRNPFIDYPELVDLISDF